MHKSRKRKLKQQQESNSNLSFYISLLLISPFMMLWLYVVFTNTKPFLISDYWEQSAILPIALVAIPFAWTILKFDIGNIADYLIEHTFSIFLLKLTGYYGIGILLSLIFMYFPLPVIITQKIGVSYQEQGIAKKYDHGGRGCAHYLDIQLKNLSDRICITKERYYQLSNQEFEIKIFGKKSKFGVLVQSIEIAEQP